MALIITKGKAIKEIPRNALHTCHACDSRILFVRNDIQVGRGERGTYEYVRCPACGRHLPAYQVFSGDGLLSAGAERALRAEVREKTKTADAGPLHCTCLDRHLGESHETACPKHPDNQKPATGDWGRGSDKGHDGYSG